MAITGTFTADFSSFSAAVNQAQVTLNGFEANSNKVQGALERMSNSLSGTKMIADATLMAEAVERIGGVTKLTEAELQSLGAKAAEAAEKMRAMGHEVPDNLQQIADAAEKANTPMEGLGARMTGLVEAGRMAVDSFKELITIGTEWVTSANAQENATVRLTTALKNQGTYTPEVARQYDELASQFESTTIYADELLMEVEALLATIGGVMPKDMRAALQATTDLAAGLRIDLPSAAQMVARALEGNTTSLHKQGIEISQVAIQTQGATAVFDAIEAKMGGGAAQQAKTFGGELKRLGNQVDNTKETLGDLIADGLQPLIDAFTSLPKPVQEGIVALGLIGGAVATLVIGIGGLVAAAKLALPLLGFSEAAAGATALTGLGAAATATAAAFGPLAIAITAVWAAWKLGNTETVKNTVATWALSSDALGAAAFRAVSGIEKMTPAAAAAAVAATAAGEAALKQATATGQVADTTTRAATAHASYTDLLASSKAKVDAMTTAQQDEVLAAKALGATNQELLKDFGLNAAAVDYLTKKHQEGVDGLKKWTAAAAELSTVGQGWKQTLADINPWILQDMEASIKAGASLKDLVTYYGMSESEGRAFEAMLKDQTKAQEDATKAQAEHDAMRLTGLSNQIKAMETLAAANAKGYGTQEQIKNLQALDAQEKALTQSVYDNITSEKERMKLIEQYGAKHAEIQGKIIALENQRAQVVNAQVIAELNAGKQLNAGTAETETAYTKMMVALDALHAKKVEGINQTNQENVIYQQYTDALLQAAQADDAAMQAAARKNDELAKTPPLLQAATAAMKVYQGGIKMPGSSIENAFGTQYLVGPNGQRIEIGPHGELPDNLDQMFAGGASFSSGTSNQARIGTGYGTATGGGINLFVTQPLGTPEAIASAVGDALMSRIRATGTRTP